VLPPEQMAGLLADELERRGFQRDGTRLTRHQNGVTVTVETTTATVTVAAEASEETTIQAERSDRAYDDVGPHAKVVRENLKKQLEKDIDKKAGEKTASLQTQVTDRLERELSDVRQELDQAINRVTAEALKRKAAQMGQIKEMTEDPQAGSLTIVVEV
jgi:FtsH ternary system domain X5